MKALPTVKGRVTHKYTVLRADVLEYSRQMMKLCGWIGSFGTQDLRETHQNSFDINIGCQK
jgi:hypothetical protein